MKTEKIMELYVELDETELKALNEAITVLEEIKATMEQHECETLKCRDEYTYDISDVKTTIENLEIFKEISGIFY